MGSWRQDPIFATVVQHARGPNQAWSVLEHKLLARLAETKMTTEDINIAQACLAELEKAVAQLGAGWRVKPFGSLANGFGRHGSDLDATCFLEGQANPPTRQSALQVQQRLVRLFHGSTNIQVVEEVREARVPILRLKFASVLDVDLSFHNVEPLPNTQLLRAYAALSPCVRDLGVMLKLWAEAAGVSGAARGHLSAYALTLMALYFLQVEPGARMPCLPTLCFDGGGGLPQAAARLPWSCAWPRAELLRRFFCFFARDFRWGTEVVSVRCGRRAASSEISYGQLRGRLSARLHIEDPFLTARNLHCTLGHEQEQTLYDQLAEAAQAMQRGALPVGMDSAPAGGGPWGMPASAVQASGCCVAGVERLGTPEAIANCADHDSERESDSTKPGFTEAEHASSAAGSEPGSDDLEHPASAQAPTQVHVSAAGPLPADLPVTLLQGTWSL